MLSFARRLCELESIMVWRGMTLAVRPETRVDRNALLPERRDHASGLAPIHGARVPRKG
jgi:hypothetical protein